MKLISKVTPSYNEEGNVEEVSRRIRETFQKLPGYDYEHVFIDNASKDNTVPILKRLAAGDKRIKLIVNARNFGHIRSPFYGLLQSKGDAASIVAADMQEPPELIADFIKKWEEGFKIVVAIKKSSEESPLMFAVRKLYYRMVTKLADVELVRNYHGFGLYDKRVIEILRQIDDPYPYFRGLICEIGFKRAEVEFDQPARKSGKSNNNFYALFDMAMLGITSFSKVPMRLASIFGFTLSLISLLISLVYLVLKLLFWREFVRGTAPILISMFFFASVQLFFIGLVGEYVGAIYTKVLKRPLVIESERVNM